MNYGFNVPLKQPLMNLVNYKEIISGMDDVADNVIKLFL
jgi:hypothetical protein